MKVNDLLKELAKVNGDLEVRLGVDEGKSLQMVSIQRVVGATNCLLLVPDLAVKNLISQPRTPKLPSEE